MRTSIKRLTAKLLALPVAAGLAAGAAGVAQAATATYPPQTFSRYVTTTNIE